MVDSTLKKELIVHNIYSAWQFIEYSLAVLGEISISGTMMKVDELANSLQVLI